MCYWKAPNGMTVQQRTGRGACVHTTAKKAVMALLVSKSLSPRGDDLVAFVVNQGDVVPEDRA